MSADDRFYERAALYLEGEASEADVDALAGRLREDAETRRVFARLLDQHAGLRWIHAGPAFPAALPPRREWKGAAVAAGLALAALTAWAALRSERTVGTLESIGPEVVVERDGRPIEASSPLRAGDRVRTGAAGAVSLRLASESATLRLREESSLEVKSASRFELERGTLVAEVAPRARSLAVDSPHAAVEVLGTEFVLAVGPRATEVSVRSGRVRLVRKRDGAAIEVAAGHRAVVGTGADLAAHPLRPPENLLRNGGFETGTPEGWDDRDAIYSPGAAVGREFAAAGGFGAGIVPRGGIGQKFPTRPGRTYYVSFRLRVERERRRPSWGGIRVMAFRGEDDRRFVQIAASPFVTLPPALHDGSDYLAARAGEWRRVRFSFIAAGDSTILRCSHFTDGEIEASADDFVVSEEPQPE